MSHNNSQTLNLLQQIGMDDGYPNYLYAYIVSENNYREVDYSPLPLGTRSDINLIPEAKLTMVFIVFDRFIDEKYGLVGQKFSEKYDNLGGDSSYDKILKELFRIAKLIRNVLIHEPARFSSTNTHVEIRHRTDTSRLILKMSHEALSSFYTAVIMYVRGNLGTGAYFHAVISTLYATIKHGLETIEDKSGTELNPVDPLGYTLNLGWRRILKDPGFSFDPSLRIHIDTSKAYNEKWFGLDYALIHQGKKILIPVEALNTGLQISENQLSAWEYQGPFPPFDPVISRN